jgi:competence protein ComEC
VKILLFDGDEGAASEMEMVSKEFDLKADVLKIGHHGSKQQYVLIF